MAEERTQRRLAAILAADVVGYSRMMGVNEAGTLTALKAWHKDIVHLRRNARLWRSRPPDLLLRFPVQPFDPISGDRWPDDARLSDIEGTLRLRSLRYAGRGCPPEFSLGEGGPGSGRITRPARRLRGPLPDFPLPVLRSVSTRYGVLKLPKPLKVLFATAPN